MLAAVMFRGSLCLAIMLTPRIQALSLKIQDVTSNINLVVISHRTISLSPGSMYILRCSPYSAIWSSDHINSTPNDSTTSTAFYKSQTEKHTLVIQNFTDELSGNYTCSTLGEEKTVTVVSSNPSVITSTQHLYFTFGNIAKSETVLLSGVPTPSLNDVQWFLNDTIPVSTLPGFTKELSTLSFPPEVTYDLCGKYTIVVNTSAGVAQDSFTVSVGIKPFTVVTPDRVQAVLGATRSLTCVDTQAVPPPSFSWSKCVVRNNCTQLENGPGSNVAFLSTHSNTTVLMIDPVQLKDGGIYRCEAENNHGKVIQEAIVELSLPQPKSVTLSVTPGPYFAGHAVQLTCTTSLADAGIDYDSITSQFVWMRGNESVEITNGRVSTIDLMTNGSSRSQQLFIDPLSHTHDSHQQYICIVVLTVNGVASPPMKSPSIPINVKVLQNAIHVSPLHITALDVPPYNQFSIICLSENPRNFSLDYGWFIGANQLVHGQNGVSITETNGSVINIVAGAAAAYSVSCKVRGSSIGQELFHVEHSSLITIRGPSVPLLPTRVTTTMVGYNQADIELWIHRITYTPEQYYVQYGTSSEILEHQSDVHTGNADVTTVGERVLMTLNHLQYNTQYYYSIVTRNSVGTSTSSVNSFQTDPLVLVQVRAGPFQGCRANKVLQSASVNKFFRTSIVDAINRRCFCDFPLINLINGTVLCPHDGSRDLVYRGYLVQLDHLSSRQLLSYVEEWVKSGPYISSGVAAVHFNPNCSSSVVAANESVCPLYVAPSPVTQGFPFGNTVILVVTVIIGLILVLVVVILVLVGVVVVQNKRISSIKKRKKNVYKLTRQESYRSATGSGSSGVSGVASVTALGNVSGFADQQGVDWSKGTSVTDCPAYGRTSYVPIVEDQELSDVRQDSAETTPSKSIPCIYDTIHQIPRAVQLGDIHAGNPRLAVSSCDANDDNSECETVAV